MKHDLPWDPAEGDVAFSGRLSALAAGLREDGVEPARDLWPDIERAMDAKVEADVHLNTLNGKMDIRRK